MSEGNDHTYLLITSRVTSTYKTRKTLRYFIQVITKHIMDRCELYYSTNVSGQLQIKSQITRRNYVAISVEISLLTKNSQDVKTNSV